MTESRKTLSVHILDKEYRILCKTAETESLTMSALYLDKKMREIRNSGKVVGLERIAVMAALNITHDYLLSKSNKEDYIQSVREELQGLLEKIEGAIRSHQTEFAYSDT